jgi:hypothetical protein
MGVKRGSSPNQVLRQLLAEYGKPHERTLEEG